MKTTAARRGSSVSRASIETPAVYAVVDPGRARHVSALLESADAEYRMVERAAPADLSFCVSRASVAMIATDDAPLSRVVQLFGSGIELPLLVLCNRATPERRAELQRAGVGSCHALSITAGRLRAVLRRLASGRRPSTAADVGLWIDPALMRVGHGSASVGVTRCELALLQALIAQAGQAVASHRLLLCGWGADVPARSANQLVTVHMHNLRRKLERVGLRGAITTVRGFGYMIAARS